MPCPSECALTVKEMPSVAPCYCEVVRIERLMADSTYGRARRCRARGLLRSRAGLRQGKKEVAEKRVRASLRRHLQGFLCVCKKWRMLSEEAGVSGTCDVLAEVGVRERPVSARSSLDEAAEILRRDHPNLSEGSRNRVGWIRGHGALYQNR